jgi:hypothetical protein
LPEEEDELVKKLEEIQADLSEVRTVEEIAAARRYNARARTLLDGHSDADVFDALQRLRSGQKSEAGVVPKLAEFEILASGRSRIGADHPASRLFAETLPDARWRTERHRDLLDGIDKLVAVHRLREVSALYGFTRFEAAPNALDGDFEDIALAVDGAPITREKTWLPAVEQFGEGIFLQLKTDAVRRWLHEPGVLARAALLAGGHQRWASGLKGAPAFPGLGYVLLHSLSHALMSEIALDCGYPASALKERIYALAPTKGLEPDRFGLLIYTASAGAQGTLGGLVATIGRFAAILNRALDTTKLCSNDPVCSDHVPDAHSGDRATHGAACHACLLVAETSCENRNLLLDRTLLVETMVDGVPAFFRTSA